MSTETNPLPPPLPPARRPPPLPPSFRVMPYGQPVNISEIQIRPPLPPVASGTDSAPALVPIRFRPVPPLPPEVDVTKTPSAPPLIPIGRRPPPPVPVRALPSAPPLPIGRRPPPPPPPRPFPDAVTPSAPPQELVIAPPARLPMTLVQAVSCVQRKFRAIKASRVFQKFRTLLHGFRMENTDPRNVQRSDPLVVRTFSTEQGKEKVVHDLDDWSKSWKQIQFKSDTDFQLIKDCADLKNDIADAVHDGLPGNVIGVYDERGTLQAAAFVSDEHGFFEIVYVVTAPWNQEISVFKNDPRRVRGAGTAVIEEAIVDSMKAGYGGVIHLDAKGLAVPFYEKVDFVHEEREPKYSHLKAMRLTNISEFFRLHGGRAAPA